jgi:multiple sugar transport system ATP-binding protein
VASVEIRNIRKNFGTVPVIHGVSIDIQDGEFVILVGPSGCGKVLSQFLAMDKETPK